MTLEIPATTPLIEQPPKTMRFKCGLAFFGVLLSKGMVIPQHKHTHSHATYIGSGSARYWANGVYMGIVGQAEALELPAETEHVFQALEDGTLITCVWPDSLAEHFEIDVRG